MVVIKNVKNNNISQTIIRKGTMNVNMCLAAAYLWKLLLRNYISASQLSCKFSPFTAEPMGLTCQYYVKTSWKGLNVEYFKTAYLWKLFLRHYTSASQLSGKLAPFTAEWMGLTCQYYVKVSWKGLISEYLKFNIEK